MTTTSPTATAYASTQQNKPDQASTVNSTQQLFTNFASNILDDYQQATYHFKFFMGDYTVWDLDNASDILKGNIVTIAESGVTGSYYIKSVEIKNVVGAMFRSKTTKSTEVNIELEEIAGMSLYDRIYAAALQLSIPNFTKTPFYLALTFKGYTDTGSIVTDPIGGITYLYRISIVDIKSSFRDGHGSYSIRAVPLNEMAYQNGPSAVLETFNYEGNDVLGAFSAFAQHLTKTQSNMYETFPKIEYDIQFHTETFDDSDKADLASKLTIAQDQSDKQDSTTKAFVNNGSVNKIQIGKDTTVMDAITWILSSTKFFIEKLNRSKTTNTTGTSQTDDNDVQATFWKILVQTNLITDNPNTDYDWIYNEWRKKITYHIYAYTTAGINLPPEQTDGTAMTSTDLLLSKEEQQKRILYFRNKKVLVKRYDYYYTGINTEVLNLDLNFNYQWAAVLSAFYGTRTYAQNSVPAIYNEIATKQGQAATVQIQLAKINTQLQQLDASSAKDANTETQRQQLIQQQAAAQTQLANIAASARAAAANSPTRFQFAQKNTLGNTYIETYNPRNKGVNTPPVPITMTPEIKNTNNKTDQAVADGWERGKSFLTSSLNQMDGQATGDLIEIQLEIRGDPYWLGRPDVEPFAVVGAATDNTKSAKSNEKMPNYDIGENYFLLKFNFPTGYDNYGNLTTTAKSDTITAIYAVNEVVHTFAEGTFRQTLTAIIERNTNISQLQV